MLARTGLYAESWNVAWRKKGKGSILTDKETPFQVIPNSFRYWAADPFFFEYQGEVYIFAELFDYIRRRGTLGYCKLGPNGAGKWKKVIEEDYHLSYPFIRQDGKDIYIIPESGAARDLHVYKAKQFPDQWEKCQTIRKDVVYGDTTPFRWQDRQMALTYDVADDYRLLLIDLDHPERDMEIAGEANIQRPAGGIFHYDGRVIRPAQNCVHDYGEGLVFNQITFDGNQNYRETELQGIIPENLRFSQEIIRDGIHTYNATDEYEVIDIKTRRFNILNLVFRILNKLGV